MQSTFSYKILFIFKWKKCMSLLWSFYRCSCNSKSQNSKLVVEHFPTCTCIVSKLSPMKRQYLHASCLQIVLSNECMNICFLNSVRFSKLSSSHFLGYWLKTSVCFLLLSYLFNNSISVSETLFALEWLLVDRFSLLFLCLCLARMCAWRPALVFLFLLH